MTPTDRRLTGLFGIVSAALSGASFLFVLDAPKLGTGAADQLGAWLIDNRAGLLASSILGILGITASLAFLTGLRGLLRDAEGGRSLLADLGLVSAVLLFAVVAVGIVALQAGALLAQSDAGTSTDLARLASASLLASFAVSAGPTLLLAGCYGAIILRTRAIPAWLGWALLFVGLVHVGALVSVARTGVLAPEGLFALGAPILYEAWQVVTAVVLLRSGER
jgi:hypothetical protein